VGKADALREERGKCTSKAAGVEAQTSRKRFAEITSGKTSLQPRLTATGKDREEERQQSFPEE
jgi:hypothetical protein